MNHERSKDRFHSKKRALIQQIFIFIFGVSGIWLVGRTDKWKKYGYVAGLLGQPFWFYTGIVNKQWGIVFLCCFYTYSWGYGVWNHWIKNKEQS